MTQEIIKKPKWLRSLEKQSWQAELVISGIAIFGSLQIPLFLNKYLDYVLASFEDSSLAIFYYFFFYLYLGSAILIGGFILHFIIRALWIGIIGLSSVFPKGINVSSNYFSSDFLKKVKSKYGDLNSFIQRLDNISSLILSIVLMGFLTFVMISIWVLIMIIAYSAILNLFRPEIVEIISIVFISIFMFMSFFGATLNMKSLREKAWVKKIHFPVLDKMNTILLFSMNEVYSYIYYTLITNLKMKKNLIFGFVFGFILLSTLLLKRSSNFDLLEKDYYFHLGSNPNTSNSFNYEDQFAGNRILNPTIQSEIISDNHLRLFIPKIKRNLPFIIDRCGKYKKTEGISKNENIIRKDSFNLDCLTKFYSISIDNIPIEINFRNSIHKNNGEKGYISYIPIDELSKGNHLLKIERGYLNEEGEESVQYIPFLKD